MASISIAESSSERCRGSINRDTRRKSTTASKMATAPSRWITARGQSIGGSRPARSFPTMTVVAHGNHIATWVNGYQVVDFTDTRLANDNARNGSKTAAGAISIQGHDPTTDLSFRNIRITELPKRSEPQVR